jgi:biopolymer transport protein ExbD
MMNPRPLLLLLTALLLSACSESRPPINEKGVHLPLCKDAGQPFSKQNGCIAFTIHPDGTILAGDTRLSDARSIAQALTDAHRNFEGISKSPVFLKIQGSPPAGFDVIIRADRNAPFRSVLMVLDAARQAGLEENVLFSVAHDEGTVVTMPDAQCTGPYASGDRVFIQDEYAWPLHQKEGGTPPDPKP